jgi:uncharacterized membrane protein
MTRRPHYRFATPEDNGLRWSLVRNCSITPRQFGALYGSLCCVSLVISIGFWVQGVPLVAPFAALELLVVGVAFLFYARHATDGERVRLMQGQLEIEIESAGARSRIVFFRQWVRVNAPSTPLSLIEVTGQGQTVMLGRHIRPDLREALAKELAGAVRFG